MSPLTPAEKQRAYRARQAAADGRTLGPVGRPQGAHGTPGSYNRGCRCDACRAANTARVRAQRAARRNNS